MASVYWSVGEGGAIVQHLAGDTSIFNGTVGMIVSVGLVKPLVGRRRAPEAPDAPSDPSRGEGAPHGALPVRSSAGQTPQNAVLPTGGEAPC